MEARARSAPLRVQNLTVVRPVSTSPVDGADTKKTPYLKAEAKR